MFFLRLSSAAVGVLKIINISYQRNKSVLLSDGMVWKLTWCLSDNNFGEGGALVAFIQDSITWWISHAGEGRCRRWEIFHLNFQRKRFKPKCYQRRGRRPSWSYIWWPLSHNLKLTCKDWDWDTTLWLVHQWTIWRNRSGSRSPTSSWAMLNPCHSKASSGKFASCKSATLLSTRLRLNHFWPNSYSVSLKGGRSFEFRPYSPTLWRWLRATYQGVPFSESTLSKEGWHLVSIMIRCYDLCFTSSNQCMAWIL